MDFINTVHISSLRHIWVSFRKNKARKINQINEPFMWYIFWILLVYEKSYSTPVKRLGTSIRFWTDLLWMKCSIKHFYSLSTSNQNIRVHVNNVTTYFSDQCCMLLMVLTFKVLLFCLLWILWMKYWWSEMRWTWMSGQHYMIAVFLCTQRSVVLMSGPPGAEKPEGSTFLTDQVTPNLLLAC